LDYFYVLDFKYVSEFKTAQQPQQQHIFPVEVAFIKVQLDGTLLDMHTELVCSELFFSNVY
jgi:hypothetical protein